MKQCDTNHAEQEIKQLTSDYYHNLLVIIDDVWNVEDAEPLVKAFSNCKTILTTRMNDIEQYIPSKHSVTVGPMTLSEGISLLTNGVIDSSKLSQEDVSLLNEISQDVHLWPLLLSLIRGQLFHYLKQFHFCYHNAIQNVQAKLHHKGLTAFDRNNITTVSRSRKLAVRACIEATLELLTKPLSDRIKQLILVNGIGASLLTVLLRILWKVSRQEADETVDILWAYGLVQYTDITVPPFSVAIHCVEVHAVITQYIIECMDCYEVDYLLPWGQNLTYINSCGTELKSAFQQLYMAQNVSPPSAIGYLKYCLFQIENMKLPFVLKHINMYTVTDPFNVLLKLQQIKDAVMCSPNSRNLLSLLSVNIDPIMINCKQVLKDAHKICRKLNQCVQRNLYEKNYDKLLQTIEEFIKNYPLCNVVQKAITMIKKIIKYCDGELLDCVLAGYEQLQLLTVDNNSFTMLILPLIKMYIKRHKRITSSLLNGSPHIEQTFDYLTSNKNNEELELIISNYFIRLQEIAPNYTYPVISTHFINLNNHEHN